MLLWILHSLENTIFTWAGWIVSISSYIVWAPLQKTYKWYKNYAIRIIVQMVLNAQKIYVITAGQRMTFLQFIKNVVLSWVIIQEDLPKNMPPDERVICLTGCHFPSMLLPNPGAKNQRPGKRCWVCYRKGNRSAGDSSIRTRYVCNQCPSVSGLHPDKCFEIYHTNTNYGSNDEQVLSHSLFEIFLCICLFTVDL